MSFNNEPENPDTILVILFVGFVVSVLVTGMLTKSINRYKLSNEQWYEEPYDESHYLNSDEWQDYYNSH